MSTAPDTGRIALVTGGSGGIGQAVVERLVMDGYSVAVHHAGNRAKAGTLVQNIITGGGSAITVGGDVADEDAMRTAFDQVEDAFGGIDVVVNTAGIMILAPLASYDLDDFDRVIRTNVRGTFIVSQLAANRVRDGGPSSTSPPLSPGPSYQPTDHTLPARRP